MKNPTKKQPKIKSLNDYIKEAPEEGRWYDLKIPYELYHFYNDIYKNTLGDEYNEKSLKYCMSLVFDEIMNFYFGDSTKEKKQWFSEELQEFLLIDKGINTYNKKCSLLVKMPEVPRKVKCRIYISGFSVGFVNWSNHIPHCKGTYFIEFILNSGRDKIESGQITIHKIPEEAL
jgi:hypothetical protein